MIITTGDHSAAEPVQRAMALSKKSGARFVPRNRTSLSKLAQRYGDDDILVILEGGARLHRTGAEPLTFHPSMAFVRAKRLLRGEPDTMLEAAGVRPGDTIIDCTAGLGADSSVFSLGAGPSGRVIALEDSLSLWALLTEGLSYYESGVTEYDEALRRIETEHVHHLQALKGMPDNSADIVYFDPMFRDPITESSAISPLRTFANNEGLSLETIEEACRVARRSVVLKEKKGSEEFARLGFQEVGRSHTKIVYGVISLDD
ncbi:class I SAM-dependent methyltransferase [Paenibacillus sp. D2_2]|uniref:class I SAM-dependent methyltransferase n=1 Tax=Paenibacillus sp. D2_2 TaxID=3073092 RepID=UPI00281628FA|nr:class I SAM-dependent methyltransferase [Paenibacillus sp. D2_2]WMT42889.1 class I SAM-dependent methyltransferase [Paenibacillus sp. D2_2]